MLPGADHEPDLAAAIADAAAAREPIAIHGNATKSAMLRPVQAARSISTSTHRGIVFYSPNELVIRARAGTPLPEIESALAERGQHLIAEPPDLPGLFGTLPPQTIGGIVAANLSGPRRVAWGATRDHVLGIRAINGTGEVFRSGGRVLKNVTGLDLCKLLTGSHGTLGLLTEITLKVLPAPERTGSLAIAADTADAAVHILSQALGSPFSVSAAAWLPPEAAAPHGFTTGIALARIEDFAPSVTYRLGRLRDQLGGDILDHDPSCALWRAIRDAQPLRAEPNHAIWRVSVRPGAGPAIYRAITQAFPARAFLDWGGGLVWIAGPSDAKTHAAIATAAHQAGGTWTLFRAPHALAATIDVIPPEPPVLAAITRRIKAVMDPAGILNPGRLYPGL